MVLTGIVVAVSATAFALALARRIHAITGAAVLDEEGEEA
jgi:multicomponent Na+:H+ antiporter subunit C